MPDLNKADASLGNSRRATFSNPVSNFNRYRVLTPKLSSFAEAGLALSLQCHFSSSPKRLLIVEDDAATRFALSKILTYTGYEVSTAATLAAALVKCEDHDCVLLDLHLPDGLGLEVLRRLREKGGRAHIAVCSAAYDPELRQRVEHYRPDAVFIKPIDLDALLNWIKRCCEQRPSQETSTDDVDTLNAAGPRPHSL